MPDRPNPLPSMPPEDFSISEREQMGFDPKEFLVTIERAIVIVILVILVVFLAERLL